MTASTVLFRLQQHLAGLIEEITPEAGDGDPKLAELFETASALLVLERAVIAAEVAPNLAAVCLSAHARVRTTLFAIATTSSSSLLWAHHLRDLGQLFGERTSILRHALQHARNDERSEALDGEAARLSETTSVRNASPKRGLHAGDSFA